MQQPPNVRTPHDLSSIEEVRMNGHSLYIERFTGQVIASQKREEVQIWSSGGGGYVSAYGGTINPAKIHSSSRTKQEFWLRNQAGIDRPFQVYGDLPILPGHFVTTINVQQGRELVLLGIVTHNDGGKWEVDYFKRVAVHPNFRFVLAIVLPLLALLAISLISESWTMIQALRAPGVVHANERIREEISGRFGSFIFLGGVMSVIIGGIVAAFTKSAMRSKLRKRVAETIDACAVAIAAGPRHGLNPPALPN